MPPHSFTYFPDYLLSIYYVPSISSPFRGQVECGQAWPAGASVSALCCVKVVELDAYIWDTVQAFSR